MGAHSSVVAVPSPVVESSAETPALRVKPLRAGTEAAQIWRPAVKLLAEGEGLSVACSQEAPGVQRLRPHLRLGPAGRPGAPAFGSKSSLALAGASSETGIVHPRTVGQLTHTKPCEASSADGICVSWSITVRDAFPDDDTQRSVNGRNIQLCSKTFGLPGICKDGSSWRLIWAVFDHGDSEVSLYLQRVLPGAAEAGGPVAGADGAIIMCNAPAGDMSASSSTTDSSCDVTDQEVQEREPPLLSWQVEVRGLTGGICCTPDYTGIVPPHTYTAGAAASPGGKGSCTVSGSAGLIWGLQGLVSAQQLSQLLQQEVLHVSMAIRPGPDHVSGKVQHTLSAAVKAAAADGTPDAPRTPAVAPHSSRPSHHVITAERPAGVAAPNGSTSPAQLAQPSEISSMQGPAILTELGPPAPASKPLDVRGRAILVSLSPRIILVEDFLEPELCQDLINLATPRCVRSRVSTGTETPSRTSRGTFFTGEAASHPLVLAVEERIEALMAHPSVVGGKKKLVKSEALQAVTYGPGAFYSEHYDNKAGGAVTRSATIIVYLNDCEEGGATFFPRATGLPTDQDVPCATPMAALAQRTQELHADVRAHRPGIRVYPATGRALIFWSALPDGREDLASLHAAEPVRRGVKWIASRWFKEVAQE